MSSPFAIFRRYQRTLMVVITGVAMISFVLLGAVPDPQHMPPALIVLLLACVAGGAAWVAGLAYGKAGEWGVSGLLVGAILGAIGMFYNREASAVLIDNGNLSVDDVQRLSRQRSIANQFTQLAFQESAERNQFELMMMAPRLRFGFTNSDNINIQDLVLGEVLRREANRLGLTVTDETALNFINDVTDKKMTQQLFTKIRKQMRLSERDILDALKSEIKARQAFNLLYSRNELPPETFWQFYRQLNVRQSADIASIPVDSFIDPELKPTESELQDLFVRYKANFPGATPEGRREEGRPGFMQPRRIELGYLEATYDAIEPLVGEVSDEEIETRYAEMYLRAVPESNEDGAMPPDLPFLPDLPLPGGSAPGTEDPFNTETPPGEPAVEENVEIEVIESEPAAPASDTENAPASSEETPASESNEPSSAIPAVDSLIPVAFFQDEEAAAQPASETENEPAAGDAESTATPESGAADAPVAPADDNAPASEGDIPDAPSTDAIEPPPAPVSSVPPLDDTMRMRLRDDILRERTRTEIQKRIRAAYDFLSDLSYFVGLDPKTEGHVPLEEATKRIEQYAQEHALEYLVTPSLSYEDLRNSDDFPIGSAMNSLGTQQIVADTVFQSSPRDLLRVGRADQLATQSAFVYWKLADKAAYEPKTLDDEPIIRESVTKAWRQLKAQPLAQARAEELAKKVRESTEPMSEVLGETTVTGAEDSLFMTVRQTGDFTWMQRAFAPPTGLNQAPQVRWSVIPGVEDAGARFYETIFNELNAGDVAVVPNDDNTAYYVVKITKRFPSTPEEEETLRKQFLSEAPTASYSGQAQQTLAQYSIDWGQRLFDKHEVVILEDPTESL